VLADCRRGLARLPRLLALASARRLGVRDVAAAHIPG
jgi:hypothetical protein